MFCMLFTLLNSQRLTCKIFCFGTECVCTAVMVRKKCVILKVNLSRFFLFFWSNIFSANLIIIKDFSWKRQKKNSLPSSLSGWSCCRFHITYNQHALSHWLTFSLWSSLLSFSWVPSPAMILLPPSKLSSLQSQLKTRAWLQLFCCILCGIVLSFVLNAYTGISSCVSCFEPFAALSLFTCRARSEKNPNTCTLPLKDVTADLCNGEPGLTDALVYREGWLFSGASTQNRSVYFHI